MGLLSAATSLQSRKIRNLHKEEMEDSDNRKEVEFVKAVLYYWHKFRVETEDENAGGLEKNEGEAE